MRRQCQAAVMLQAAARGKLARLLLHGMQSEATAAVAAAAASVAVASQCCLVPGRCGGSSAGIESSCAGDAAAAGAAEQSVCCEQLPMPEQQHQQLDAGHERQLLERAGTRSSPLFSSTLRYGSGLLIAGGAQDRRFPVLRGMWRPPP
jgi:hypothetical protein